MTSATPADPLADVDDTTLSATVFRLLAARAPGATVCPSEVARALLPAPADWRALMPRIRRVARDLANRGLLDVTRGGATVDATSRGGPIRLGRPRAEGDR